MTRPELEQLTISTAMRFAIEPALLCALVHHESDWNPWAIRYEPAFYERYVKNLSLSETEERARSFSYGLGQVMGQVAREQGFKAKYMTELLDPRKNLEQTAIKLSKCLAQKNQNVRLALLMYNGGGSPNYPDLVMQHYDKYK